MTSSARTRLPRLAAAVVAAALAIGSFASPPAEEFSLAGKTIGVTVIGTAHHRDFMALRGQIETIERFGGRVIALDAHHNDRIQITHIRDLIAKRPHAIIQQPHTPQRSMSMRKTRLSRCIQRMGAAR